MKLIYSEGHIIPYYGDVDIVDKFKTQELYIINQDKKGDVILNNMPLFTLPNEIFDVEKAFRERVLSYFKTTQEINTGVFLKGSKGQGKSLLAKQLALESGLPIFIINRALGHRIPLKEFLNAIPQEYVLLIDEFEKIIPNADIKEDLDILTQEYFLSLLSGTDQIGAKRLVILTSNGDINKLFLNRPERLRYKKEYEFLSEELTHLIIDKKLLYPEFKADLLENLDLYSCNIDILISIINEINLYQEPFSKWKSWFNYTPPKQEYFHEILNKETNKWVYTESISSSFNLFTIANQENNKDFPSYLKIIGVFKDSNYIYSDLIRNVVMTDKEITFEAPFTTSIDAQELSNTYENADTSLTFSGYISQNNIPFYKHKLIKIC